MISIRSLIIGLLALALSSCGGGGGSDSSSSGCGALNAKIYNGDSCSSKARSPVVALFPVAKDGSRFEVAGICTGVLVTVDDIVTSAHCFIEPYRRLGKQLVGFGVLAGGSEDGEILAVVNWKIHPRYNGAVGSPYDIAMATLERVPSPAIGPVPLAMSVQTQVGDDVTAFGYGTSNKGEIGELKAADFVIDSILNGNLSATFKEAGASICSGDSGGPLVKDVNGASSLVGINSFYMGTDVDGCGQHGASISGFVDIQYSSIVDFITGYASDVAVR